MNETGGIRIMAYVVGQQACEFNRLKGHWPDVEQIRSNVARSVGDPDPDPKDLQVFGPPGSGSISQK
jgi:hypothetical protein